MANGVKFELKGIPELNAKLKTLGPEVATKVGQSAVRSAGRVMEKAISAAAPVGDGDTSRTYTKKIKGSSERETVKVDYGHLKDNIKTRKGRPRKEHNVVAVVTTGNAFWGRFLEFGTEKMAPQPFFGPAADASADAALQAMFQALSKGIDRAAKKMRRTL